jgi:transposase
VLCADEKSQIQALDRTQPGLPLQKGRCGTMTHDYKRHGTTTLFAGLEVLTGQLIGTCLPTHRHQEGLRFLRLIDTQTPLALDLHLIVDNYATHKHPAVRRWLARHPRFHLHFIPTSSSWLKPDRAVVPRAHAQAASPRGVPECRRSHRRHRGLHRAAQRPPPVVHVAREGGGHPGESRAGASRAS